MAFPDIDEIWSRMIAGEAISSNEEACLLDVLENDESQRRRLIRDEQIEGLLISQGHCAVLEDQLIDQLSARLSAAQRSSQKNRSDRLAQTESDCDPFSQADSARSLPSNAAVGDDIRSAAAVEARPSSTSRGKTIRPVRYWSLIGMIVAAALVAGIAIGFAVRGGRPADADRMARSAPDDGSRNDDPGSAYRTPSRALTKSTPVRRDDRQPENDTPRLNAVPKETLARLNPSPDAVWDAPVAERLGAGTLKLRSGTASVTFESGARVRLRRQAELRLISAGRAHLQRGGLSVEVPPRAVGFTIDTPAVRIVDLGTEFDVDVDPDGTTDVEVRRGRVELVPLSSAGNQSRRQLTAGERVRLAPAVSRSASSPSAPAPASKASSENRNSAAGCIVRGVLIIDGQRYEYNSEQEYEQLRKRFPRLKPLRKQRSPRSGPRPQKRSRSNPFDGSSAAARRQDTATVRHATKKPVVKRLCGIDWYPELSAALKEAAREDKPVMVFRVLGSLSGFM